MYNAPFARKNKILNSAANVSRIVSDETFNNNYGFLCDVKQEVKKVETPKQVEKKEKQLE